jgi:hypothetical protein
VDGLSAKAHAWSEQSSPPKDRTCQNAKYWAKAARIKGRKKITLDHITGILNANLLHDGHTEAKTQAEHGWLWKHQRNISRNNSSGSRLIGERYARVCLVLFSSARFSLSISSIANLDSRTILAREASAASILSVSVRMSI